MTAHTADGESIRAHASTLDDLAKRFATVKAASAQIAQDDTAYGPLCGWIAAVLEARHTRQDELVDYVAENLTLSATALRDVAGRYEATDAKLGKDFKAMHGDVSARR